MGDLDNTIAEAVERSSASRIGSLVGICVAITATFMAICNIKDGNIVQAMDKAQAKAVDTWSYYQAKRIKEHLAEQALADIQLRIQLEAASTEPQRAVLQQAAKRYEGQISTYQAEEKTIRQEAQTYEADYDRLNIHDDQFDMAEAFFTVAIALYGVTAITASMRLLAVAALFSLFGMVLGLSSFVGWHIHPDWIANILG